jgi:hypothetical protein
MLALSLLEHSIKYSCSTEQRALSGFGQTGLIPGILAQFKVEMAFAASIANHNPFALSLLNHERTVALRSFDMFRMQGERIGLSFAEDGFYESYSI